MIQDDAGLALEDLVADEGVLVTFSLVGSCMRLENDVVDELLYPFIIEESGHSVCRIDEASLDVFLV